MFCHLWNILEIETNENLLVINLESMEDVEETLIPTIFSWVCWAAVIENEGDYCFDDNT